MVNYYLVLGATNSVINHAAMYADENLAAQAAAGFTGSVSGPSAGEVISADRNGVNYRTLYLPFTVDGPSLKDTIYLLVRSVPYLHSTTGVRVFYDEQSAKEELYNFNTAVSRAQFHAYLFTFPA